MQRLMFNMAEVWRDDGFVHGHDLRNLQLPRVNPTFKTDPPAKSRPETFISPSIFRSWIKACRAADDLAYEAAFKFAVWFRLSPIDLKNLNDDELDEEAFELRIRRRHTITDKNPHGCLQVIKLDEQSWAMIARCRRFRKPGNKLLFDIQTNGKKRFLKIRKIGMKMGLRSITLSVFRRSASDHLLAKGYQRSHVADALGHTTEKNLDPHDSSKRHAPYRGQITRELTGAFRG